MIKCFIMVGSAMFIATFNLVTRVGLQCLKFVQPQTRLAKLRQRYVKKVLTTRYLSNFCTLQTIQFGSKFTSMSNTYQIMYGENFSLSVSAFATVARKIFKDKFSSKIKFQIRHFILPLLTLALEVQNLIVHYLVSIWTTCW